MLSLCDLGLRSPNALCPSVKVLQSACMPSAVSWGQMHCMPFSWVCERVHAHLRLGLMPNALCRLQLGLRARYAHLRLGLRSNALCPFSWVLRARACSSLRLGLRPLHSVPFQLGLRARACSSAIGPEAKCTVPLQLGLRARALICDWA
jgi:hypothetical protein